jgi:hypothetical protein
MYLGRFQRGQKVPIRLDVTVGSGVPGDPDEAPVVTITAPDSTVMATFKVPKVEFAVFGMPYFLGVLFQSWVSIQ